MEERSKDDLRDSDDPSPELAPDGAADGAPAELSPAMKAALDYLWTSGYEAGRKAAWREFRNTLIDTLDPLMQMKEPPAEQPTGLAAAAAIQQSGAEAQQQTTPRGSVPDIVMKMLEERPGLTGVQLVDYAAERGTPLQERSVRTALRRLRLAGKIASVDGKWYRAEDIPEVAHHLLFEDDHPRSTSDEGDQ